MLFINYYYLILRSLHDLREGNVVEKHVEGIYNDDVSEELIDELEVLRVGMLSRIDQFIRHQLQKRGISIYFNTYTGFDTEYETLDERRCLNKLLSVQTAIQRRLIVKVPLNNRYNLAYVNPLTSDISEFYQPGVNDHKGHLYTFRRPVIVDNEMSSNIKGVCEGKRIEYSELALLNNSIKNVVGKIREFLHCKNDDAIKSIINLLKERKDISWYEDYQHDQIVFIFPLTAMEKSIEYPNHKVGYSFEDLLDKSKDTTVQEVVSLTHSLTHIVPSGEGKGTGKGEGKGTLTQSLTHFVPSGEGRGTGTGSGDGGGVLYNYNDVESTKIFRGGSTDTSAGNDTKGTDTQGTKGNDTKGVDRK